MTERQPMDSNNHEPGDKVQIRSGPYIGQRGIVQTATDLVLYVQLSDTSIVQVSADTLTNYSRAARRAWQKMPKRAGRPKAIEPRKRMVSLRIDRDIWDRLSQAVDKGLIASREHAVNVWVREQLDRLEQTSGTKILSVAPEDEF